jgi:TPR repeat protein
LGLTNTCFNGNNVAGKKTTSIAHGDLSSHLARWTEMQTSTIRNLRLAAESGDAAAQFNLGILYDSRLDDNGYVIEGNRTEAIRWLLAAAEQGLSRAQSRLAELYAGGPNASGNFVNACAWFLLATKNSRGIHRHLARSGYQQVATRLTPAQLSKAKRLAGLWRARSLPEIRPPSEGQAP